MLLPKVERLTIDLETALDKVIFLEDELRIQSETASSMARGDLVAVREAHMREVERLRSEHATAIAALTKSHAAELSTARAAFNRELTAYSAEITDAVEKHDDLERKWEKERASLLQQLRSEEEAHAATTALLSEKEDAVSDLQDQLAVLAGELDSAQRLIEGSQRQRTEQDAHALVVAHARTVHGELDEFNRRHPFLFPQGTLDAPPQLLGSGSPTRSREGALAATEGLLRELRDRHSRFLATLQTAALSRGSQENESRARLSALAEAKAANDRELHDRIRAVREEAIASRREVERLARQNSDLQGVLARVSSGLHPGLPSRQSLGWDGATVEGGNLTEVLSSSWLSGPVSDLKDLAAAERELELTLKGLDRAGSPSAALAQHAVPGSPVWPGSPRPGSPALTPSGGGLGLGRPSFEAMAAGHSRREETLARLADTRAALARTEALIRVKLDVVADSLAHAQVRAQDEVKNNALALEQVKGRGGKKAKDKYTK